VAVRVYHHGELPHPAAGRRGGAGGPPVRRGGEGLHHGGATDPFRPNDTDNYVLEIGVGYIRVYHDGARVEVAAVPVEVATSYAEADLFHIHYGQMEDVLVLAEQGYRPPNSPASRIRHGAGTT